MPTRISQSATTAEAEPTSRPFAEILRANVFTRFNAILGTLLAVILVVGPFQDALFGVVLVANTLIGIVQETRAKRSLDRLAVLTAPRARIVRSGTVIERPVGEVVIDDVLVLDPGDQVVADGVLLAAEHLEIDESLLTGEAEPLAKAPGDELLSGSFAVAGHGRYRATRVGRDAYARRLAAEARSFQLVHSELRDGIDRILRVVTWLLVPIAVLLVWSQVLSHDSLPEAVRGSVAGVGAMIPEGLVLLTSLAFAAGVIRLARQRVLVQELNAIEVLARVDVVCLDKTGTLTENELLVTGIELVGADSNQDVSAALAALANAETRPNATLVAIAKAQPVTNAPAVRGTVPFSSARKWSAVDCALGGAWVLGAPEILMVGQDQPTVARRVEELAGGGARVVLMARAPSGLRGEDLPPDLSPAALVVLEERIREEARSTLDFFAAEGVTVKVLSGDHPATVASVATRVGLDAGVPFDARELPEDEVELADAVETAMVFGRVTPHQKRAMIAALQSKGHVVAMTGDGVNDVLALKTADLGVAMASGSPASRAVAPVVLLDNSFAGLPAVLAEGRRVIANIEQVAKLFVTKTVYASLLALAIGVARLPFPFLPRHLTIISSLTIGVPAFFLALAPNTRRTRPGFVARVLRFAGPAGVVAAAATFTAYALARAEHGVGLAEARTTATAALFGVGLWVLTILARPPTIRRRVLVLAMLAAFLMLMALPPTRAFFDLSLPGPLIVFATFGVVAAADLAIEAAWRLLRSLDADLSSGRGTRCRV